MIIIDSKDHIPEITNAIVTSGTFDGVHFGHKKILENVVGTAQKEEGKSVVLTFWPHPRFVLFPQNNDLKLLSTFEEKSKYFEELGIDYLIKVEFTKAFSQLSSQDFIHDVLIDKLKTKKLIIGYDHRFGKNREGSFDYLIENGEKFGFEVEEIPRQDVEEVGVSSTKIRKALLSGHVHLAAQYMGREYELQGTVVHGKQIGSDIGFPTANIHIAEEYKLIPLDGSYAVRVNVLNRWYNGMLNIGLRPTVGGEARVVETNIFGMNQDIYDQKITVAFVKRIRGEQKFSSLDELKSQLEKDKEEAQGYLN